MHSILCWSLALVALGMLYLSFMVSSSIDLNTETIALTKTSNDAPTKRAASTTTRTAAIPSSVRAHVYFANAKCEGTANMTTGESTANGASSQKSTSIQFAPNIPKSIRVQGPGELKLYDAWNKYMGSAFELEGCIAPIQTNPPPARGELFYYAKTPPSRLVNPALARKFYTGSKQSLPQTRIVFSAESSIYFGYQTVTNAYAFLHSNQTNASWLRLLTAEMPDDLSETLPTFTAPRTLYSKRYSPMNKPDILDKWLNDGVGSNTDAAAAAAAAAAAIESSIHPDDTLVVIDPDNWLLKDVQKWTVRVSRKHAIGQAAYYNGNKKVQALWQEVCRAGCNNTVAHVGVPYVIKVADMKEVAPLWRQYTLLLNEMRQAEKERFDNEYKSLYISWTSEMYGYNFACAHLGIQTEVVNDLQIRDVDARQSDEETSQKAMIHMGRAWFPQKHSALAEKWRNTEGKDFANFGIQVWCKCNRTGHEIMPWPLPDGLDFQSHHTLRLLHEAREWYGPIPENFTFRPKNGGSIT